MTDKCKACGVPWTDHLGVEGTCHELGSVTARCKFAEELLRERREEVKNLRDELEELYDTLKAISDLAHDASTGPTVEDTYWEIRRIANEAL